MEVESNDKRNENTTFEWSPFAKIYDPIKIGSIDGTDIEPHDKAIIRAINSEYYPNRHVKGKPECTIFVSRLNQKTSKDTIKEIFSQYGHLRRFRLVRDIVTGIPKGYAFIEYENEDDAEKAYKNAHKTIIDGNVIFVDFECERLLKDWKPRRLGGGFGGKKESGQLRFGGRDRPFKRPILFDSKNDREDSRERRYGRSEERRYRRSRESRYERSQERRYARSPDRRKGRSRERSERYKEDSHERSIDRRRDKSEEKYDKCIDRRRDRSEDKNGKNIDRRREKSEDKYEKSMDKRRERSEEKYERRREKSEETRKYDYKKKI